MSGVPKSWKTLEVMQELKYGLDPEKLSEMLTNWSSVKDYAYIQHDRDTKQDGTIKAPHIHCMIRFTDSVPTEAILAKFAKTYGENVIKVENLNKCHKWTAAIAYLTHDNQHDKFRYPDTDVISNYEWKTDRDKEVMAKALRRDAARAVEISEAIASGKVRQYNLNALCSALEQATYKPIIEAAFAYRLREIQAQNDREGQGMEVYWLSGAAGTGKTAFAKIMCEGRGWSVFLSGSGSDFMDGYGGQDAIILDDVRPESMAAATMLKLLDPHTRSSIKSRYANKWAECRAIIITCPVGPIEFWTMRSDSEKIDGTVGQLLRRINRGWWVFTWDVEEQTGTATITRYGDAGEVIASAVIDNPVGSKLMEWARKKRPDVFDDLKSDLPYLKFQDVKTGEWEAKEMPWRNKG